MQRLETKTNKKASHGAKWCNCGHLIVQHHYNGCTGVVEPDDAEDHNVCGCMCIECIHKNELALKTLAKELDVDKC